MGPGGNSAQGQGRAVVVVAPAFTSLARFGGDSLEAKLQLMTRRGVPASLANLDAMVNSPISAPPLARGLRRAGPMAAYYLESFLKLREYRALVIVDWDDADPLRRALRADPLAVLFSTTFVTDAGVLERCLAELRREVGTIPILVGGPFVHKQAKQLARAGDGRRAEALRGFCVDVHAQVLFREGRDPALDSCIFVASPHGEHTALAVLSQLARPDGRRGLAEIPNLVLRDGSRGWRLTGRALEPVDLDGEITRWDLIDELPAAIPIRTAVGCEGRCAFCDFRTLHRRFVARRVSSVIEEMRLAVGRGRSFFDFVDDDIFAPPGGAAGLVAGIEGAGLDIVWGGFFKADRLSEADGAAAVRAGMRFGLTGIESGHPAQLARMGKRLDLDAAQRNLGVLVGAGARIDLCFIIGFPGEDEETLEATAAFIDGAPRGDRGYAFYELFPFELYPGTVADTPRFRRRHGLEGRGTSWSHATMSARDVVDVVAPRVFGRIARTPYYHGGEDAPSWWGSARRDEGFVRRIDLVKGFLGRVDDAEIQTRFAALHALVEDPRVTGEIPRWTEILAARSAQPGGG
ncbi:MAG: radical SAM protein [Proteobacteria bacterium]|jgi:p-methyltransferase|nr:radical SAM protein [Pseudomonadota bacterium]